MNNQIGEIRETRKLMFVSALCIIIFMLWSQKEEKKAIKVNQEKQKTIQDLSVEKEKPEKEKFIKFETKKEAIDARGSEIIKFENENINGTINLVGLRIDDLRLKNYALEHSEERVDLLTPAGSNQYYYIDFGFKDKEDKENSVPSSKTHWRKISDKDGEIQFEANVSGNMFKVSLKLDEKYMWDTKMSSNNPKRFLPFVRIKRNIEGLRDKHSYSHTGVVLVKDAKLDEIKFKDIEKTNSFEISDKAWIGFGDVYWFSGIILKNKKDSGVSYKQSKNCKTCYQIDAINLEEEGDFKFSIFTGAKELKTISKYQEQFDIPLFDRVIDFGWFYFLTKPILKFINFLHGFFGNFGLAIIALTIIVRLTLFPLAQKSYKSTQKIKDIMPEIQSVRELYKDRPKNELNLAMVDVYKRNKVNPAAGCLPLFLQIPVFFALYKVLIVSIEMRDAPFIFWIQDLSDPDPTSIINLFGLLPFAAPSFLKIGVLPIIMGFTMYLQQKLSPVPQDPAQAKMMKFLPVIFTFLFAGFPSGLVLYWTINNLFGVLQQYVISIKSKKLYK